MKSWLSWFDSVGKIVAGLTGLVALVTAAVSLYFVFRPPPPKVEEARFAGARLEQFGPSTKLRSFFKLAHQPQRAKLYTPAQLNADGVYFTVPLTLLGLKGAEAWVVWSLYSVKNKTPVDDWIDQDAGSVIPPRDRSTYLVQVWVQLPQAAGRYFAVIQIGHDDNPLDAVKTKPFPGVMAEPPPPLPLPLPDGGGANGGGSQGPPGTTSATTTRPTPGVVKPGTKLRVRPRAIITGRQITR